MNLEPLLNPLRFAARRNFANLETVKDLEGTLRRALGAVQAQPGLSDEMTRALDAVAESISGLDGTRGAERRRRVSDLLRAVQAVDAGEGAPTRPKADPAVAAERRRSPAAPGRQENLSLAIEPPPKRRSKTGAQRKSSSKRGSGSVRGVDGTDTAANGSATSVESASSSADEAPSRVAATMVAAAPKVAERRVGRRIPMAKARADSSLAEIVGVGPKTAERLAAKGFRTAQDLLFFVPRQYEDRSQFTPIADLEPGRVATIRGEVAAARIRPTGRGKRVLEMAVRDDSGVVSCRFFRFPSGMEARYARGTPVVLSGPVTAWGAQRQMVHPELERLETSDQEVTPAGVLPVYGEVEGVPPKTLRRIIQGLASACGHEVVDILPPWILEQCHLPSLGAAIAQVHLPSTPDALDAVEHMRARMVFDELLLLQLALVRTRRRREEETGLVHALATPIDKLAESLLPFRLTGAQQRALDDIAKDLIAPQPMNRLLQGDVGSGKTAVALVASAAVCSVGRQAAILAPTEILADQHFGNAQAILAPANMTVARLTGSATAKERRHLLRALAGRQIDVLVGTHALLEPDVKFADLGLAIVDEQHRFGVQQRAALRNKRSDAMPDLLVMTATPIPRTLALTAYGDLRVSVIDELPPGRQPTITEVFGRAQYEQALARVSEALMAGRQAYVVYPLVEASEKLDLSAATEAVVELAERFRPHEVGLLHGRLRPEDKAAVMDRFKNQQIGVLVSTTVIEVGVDVPNATVMLVEHADRFGLSQLHQLRGRVGRGGHQGRCVLVAGDASQDGRARLQILAETSDGFKVAERDLELRGPGEVLGTRQSGLPDLVVTNLARDGRIVEQSKVVCEQLNERDPELQASEHARLKAELQRRFGERLKLTDAG